MLKRLTVMTVVVILGLSAIGVDASKATKQISGFVNINTATAAELMLLPGVGKGKADAIISYRQTSPFKAAQDITKVKGVGPKMFEKMQQHVSVEGVTTARAVKVPTASQGQTVQKTGI